MFKTLGIVIVLALAVILVLAATKPASFRVVRSAVIAAPPEKITPLLSDFHNWGQWSPWAQLDPNMKVAFSGAPSGPGAVYDWDGDSKVGKGRMEVLSVDPSKTTIKLDFLKPFEGHNTTDFVLTPQGGGTRVDWIMYGPNTFMGKVVSVFSSMDHMIGPDFERGLNNLKGAAEK